MCINCWIENDSPKILNDKVLKAAEKIKELYDSDDGGVGGYGHIVFDDFNVEDNYIDSCIEDAKKAEYDLCEETRVLSLDALNLFRVLDEQERYSALAYVNEYFR